MHQGAGSADESAFPEGAALAEPVYVLKNKNTFLDVELPRSDSMQMHFQERLIRSSPAALVEAFLDEISEGQMPTPLYTPGNLLLETAHLNSNAVFFPPTAAGHSSQRMSPRSARSSSDPEYHPTSPGHFAAVGSGSRLDRYTASAKMRARATSDQASVDERREAHGTEVESDCSTTDSVETVSTVAQPVRVSHQGAPTVRVGGNKVLCLGDALSDMPLGSPRLPTEGSRQHCLGMCKPCAYVHRPEGCKGGVTCQFCHLCEPGERKQRKQEKRRLIRAARRQRKEATSQATAPC